MDRFEKITGLPSNKHEIEHVPEEIISLSLNKHEIEYVPGKIYGLAIFPRGATNWICKIGTFPFLYGFNEAMKCANKNVDEINDLLVKEKRCDLDNDYHAAIFFELDENNKPIQIINDIFGITGAQQKDFGIIPNPHAMDRIFPDISYIYDNYYQPEEYDDYFRVPKLEFKI